MLLAESPDDLIGAGRYAARLGGRIFLRRLQREAVEWPMRSIQALKLPDCR